jgi:GcrA cell cycle regulator
MDWTPDLIEQLRGYLAQGLSCGHIAGLMGVSRNAIIGKANRLRLGLRPRDGVRATVKVQVKEIAAEADPEEPEIQEPGYSLFDLEERQCRWVIQDDPSYRFCGDKVVNGYPYCGEHARRAYPGKGKVTSSSSAL